MQQRLLNITELCQQYGLRPWTVRAYCSQRKIPHVKVGRRVYFRVDAIEGWLDDQARPVEAAGLS